MLKKTLIIMGAPIWFPLLLSVVAIVISLYVTLWAVLVSFCAVFGALVGCGVGGVAAGVIVLFTGNLISGIALIGMALVCIGLSIFAFFGCKMAIQGCVMLTRKSVLAIKNCFKREECI